VANNNNFAVKDAQTVSVLNLQTGLTQQTISDPSFVGAYRIAIDAAGRNAYVCNSDSTTLSIIDVTTNKVTHVIDGFNGPGGIVLSNTRPLAYVTNFGQNSDGHTVSVVNVNRRKIVATILVALAPQALALSPDDRFVYVVSYVNGEAGTGTLSVIRTRDNSVIKTMLGFFGPFWIALNKLGTLAYVTNFGSNDFTPVGTTVSVVNLKTLSIIKNIEIGTQPSGIAMSPDGAFAYVSRYNALYAHKDSKDLTYGESCVSIIRLKDNTIIAPTIPVGETAATLTIAPDGQKLYVCKFAQNTVAAVCLAS
jgi:YVTN family beta-propeller protein